MARKRGKQPNKQAEEHTAVVPVATRRRDLIVAGLLTLVCLAVFYQVTGFDFVNLDDDIYVYENPMVATGLSLQSIAWAFTEFHAANWHPITWLSHQLDVTLFGLNAGGHHAVNLALHIANSVFVFVLLRDITGDPVKSAFAAAVFAIHPTHVESVAWIAERKDVLSTLFWLLATLAYVRYAKDKGKRAYWLALLLFGLGLMAKPMLVTLPFTLLLLDYWPLRRIKEFRWAGIRTAVIEKLPFFALSVMSAVVTMFAQRSGGAVQSLETFSLPERIGNAVVSYARYLGMMFYPADLAVWYPFDKDVPAVVVAASALLLGGISAICIWQIQKRPYLFVGWFWFVGTLVPVIGIVQVGRQALADRYTYVPYIGLSIAAIWLLAEFAERLRVPVAALAAAALMSIAALAVVGFNQTGYWRNSESLYLRALAVTKSNYLVEANYCRFLEQSNRLDEAARHCSAAIQSDPRGVDALNTLGTVQLKQGRLDEARSTFQKVIEVDSNFSLSYANLAIIETRQRNVEAALINFDEAVSRDLSGFFDRGRRAEAYSSIGSAALAQKRYDIAVKSYERALEALPDSVEFHRNLAISLRSQGRSADAVQLLETMVKRNPNSPEAYNTLGIVYAEQNRMPEAIEQFQRALQINPNFSPAQTNLRKALDSK